MKVLNDSPKSWLITINLAPKYRGIAPVEKTLIIETEPSLWWKSEKWNTSKNYRSCVITLIHYIGKAK